MQVIYSQTAWGWSAALTPWLNRKQSAIASNDSPGRSSTSKLGLWAWQFGRKNGSVTVGAGNHGTFDVASEPWHSWRADSGPRVRVEAMRALARAQLPESAGLILDAA